MKSNQLQAQFHHLKLLVTFHDYELLYDNSKCITRLWAISQVLSGSPSHCFVGAVKFASY